MYEHFLFPKKKKKISKSNPQDLGIGTSWPNADPHHWPGAISSV